MPEMPTSLLSVRDLVVRYEPSAARRQTITAVRGVSLDVGAGRIQALVGESGSGKTSLARAILQLLPIESGQVLFRGENLGALSQRQLRQARRHVQAVFQDPLASLSPRRTIMQTLLEPLDHFRIGLAAERRERAAEALRNVGLEPELAQRYPHELSGGQRQRACLARALVTEPELIIADEPVSSLDRPSQVLIIDLIRGLRERLGLAFLLVSHDFSVVRRLADDVAVMYAGEVVESGPAGTLLDQPLHPYTRSLLASIPVPDPNHSPPLVLGGEPPSALTPPGGCAFHMRCAERLERCSTDVPEETEAVSSKNRHRVKCHLWNP